jgi:hypothetical protein
MHTLALLALVFGGTWIVGSALRGALKRPQQRTTKYRDGKPAQSAVMRPYAVVEAFTDDGTAVLPTIVYSAEQQDQAMERYMRLGCSVAVASLIH